MLRASDSSAQLMKLRQSEALCILHHHHRRIRHIDPDLDDGRRHEEVDLAREKACHDIFFFCRLHLTMEFPDLHFFWENFTDLLHIIGYILEIEHIVRLHHRTDDVGLPSLPDLLVDEFIRIFPIVLIDHGIPDRQTIRRLLPNQTHLHIRIDEHREGPWDRGRRHHERMRPLPLLRQLLPLIHAETVLLIRDHEREPVIDDLLLKQGMGADDEIRIVGGDARIERFPLLRRHRTCHEYRAKREGIRLDQRLHLRIVLLREDLRRRHHSRLVTAQRRFQHREEGDDGLSGADIALHEAVHHEAGAHICGDVMDRRLLPFGELKGQLLDQRRHLRMRLDHKCRFLRRMMRLLLRQRQREEKKLIKCEPFSGRFELIHTLREMHCPDGSPHIHQYPVIADALRDEIRTEHRHIHRLPDRLQDCVVRESLRLPIDRLQRAQLRLILLRAEDPRLLHRFLPLEARGLSEEDQHGSGTQRALQKRRVEPAEAQLSREIPNIGRRHEETMEIHHGRILLEHAHHRLLFAIDETAHRLRLRVAEIGMRKIVDEVLYGPDAQLLKQLFGFRADALQLCQFHVHSLPRTSPSGRSCDRPSYLSFNADDRSAVPTRSLVQSGIHAS